MRSIVNDHVMSYDLFRYTSEYPQGAIAPASSDNCLNTGPTIIIDVIDPGCGYDRYSDEDLYQRSNDDKYVGTAKAR